MGEPGVVAHRHGGSLAEAGLESEVGFPGEREGTPTHLGRHIQAELPLGAIPAHQHPEAAPGESPAQRREPLGRPALGRTVGRSGAQDGVGRTLKPTARQQLGRALAGLWRGLERGEGARRRSEGAAERQVLPAQVKLAPGGAQKRVGEKGVAPLAAEADPDRSPGLPREQGARKRGRQHDGGSRAPRSQAAGEVLSSASRGRPSLGTIDRTVGPQQLQQRRRADRRHLGLGQGAPQRVEQGTREQHVAQPVGQANQQSAGAAPLWILGGWEHCHGAQAAGRRPRWSPGRASTRERTGPPEPRPWTTRRTASDRAGCIAAWRRSFA